MKALYIDCCIRGEESRSARLAQAFLENLSPEYEVTHRCLMEEALYPLTAETLRQRDALLAQGKTDHPRFRFAHEIAEADLVIMAAPFWDLSFPAALRTYIEYISANGLTYHYEMDGCHGDCRSAGLVYLTSGGDVERPESLGVLYWRQLCAMFGIGRFDDVFGGGLDLDPAGTEELVVSARELAARLAAEAC